MAMFAFVVTASAEDARLLSFGFYQANNPSLAKDYVAVVPAFTPSKTTYEFEVALPAGTDVTALVAQFTVNAGNTVSIDGAAQTSGVTANDFTDPVDYMVSNSNKSGNLRYTVTVVEESAVAKVWSEVSVLDAAAVTGNTAVTGVYAGTVMKINPKDNLPYVAFGVRDADNKLTVAKFDGQAWTPAGAASFSHIVSASHYGFDIAQDGTLYVAFNDTEATNKNGISVMKYDGQAWNLVGEAGITATTAQYVGVAALEGGVIAAQQNNKKGDYAKRNVVTSAWNGAAWTSQAVSDALYARQFIASDGKDAYILTASASAPKTYSLFKMSAAGEKTVIVENYLPEGATTGENTSENSLAIAPDGTLYLLAPDDATGTLHMRLSVLKNGSFATVGGDVIKIKDAAYDRHSDVRAAIAPDGTAFVAYNDNSDEENLFVVSVDSETKQWSAPVKVASGAGTSPDVNLAFTATGIGYLSYSDKNNQIHLLKYAEADPAAIKTVATEAAARTEYYNLSGVRVAAPAKGLYIKRTVDAAGKVSSQKIRY